MRTTALPHRLAAAALLLAALAPALAAAAPAAADEHPVHKRAFNLPPSVDLNYTIRARQHGLTINGDAQVRWQAGEGRYSIATESRAALFGKILENRSEGAVDDYGIAPASFYEKRFRKDGNTTSFKRDTKTISFSEGDETYPLKGGEQDRTSAPWQLLAIARAAPDKFKPGSEWSFFVAGRRDAEAWTFKVVKNESVQTGQGEVNAVHLVKAPPPDAQGQQVDLWLAPSLDWLPVRIRFNDADGDYVDQVLDKLTKK